MRIALGVVTLFGFSSMAQAKWFEASSRHFVVYSDRGADQVRIMAGKLERFDAALRQLTGRRDEPIAPSNRVTIYMVQSPNDVSRLFGKGGNYIGGFYASVAGGSYAIVPPFNVQETGENGFAEGVLLHEYAHHFVSENQSVLYPLWLNEGFAEFVSTARFEKNGSVGMGLPGEWRGWQLTHQVTVPAEMLVDSQAYFARREIAFDQFYPRAWLLYHMLTFDAGRQGQLQKYASALSRGLADREAAIDAFGDLRQLELDLQTYGRKVTMPYYLIKGETLAPAPVQVREVDQATADAMQLRMRLARGVAESEAAGLAVDARAVAATHPAHATVQTILGQAELKAGNIDAALAAADRALAADPAAINAHILKGRGLLAKAQAGHPGPAEWNAVRAAFLKANSLDPDHPLPLLYFYETFLSQGIKPTANALQALARSLELAPYDRGIREEVAASQLARAQFDQAETTLRMLVRDPHFPKRGARIRAVIEKLEERNSEGARKLIEMSDEEFEKRQNEGDKDTGEGKSAAA